MDIQSHRIPLSVPENLPSGPSRRTVGYLHFEAAETRDATISFHPTTAQLPINLHHNTEIFGDLRSSEGQSDLDKIATQCVAHLTAVSENDTSPEAIRENSKNLSSVKKKIQNQNKETIELLEAILLTMFKKDTPALEAFSKIKESVLTTQQKIFDKKQWDFDKLIDLDSKAQTSLVAETGLASTLMTAITVAIRFAESKELSIALTTLGLAVGLAQTTNTCFSGWKIAKTNTKNIEATSKILDAQNHHRKTDVFLKDNGTSRAKTMKDPKGDEVEFPLTDDRDSEFRVFDMASRNTAVTLKMIGLASLSVLVTGGFCAVVWDKFTNGLDNDNSSSTPPNGAHTH